MGNAQVAREFAKRQSTGAAVAEALALKGARVIPAVRDLGKGRAAALLATFRGGVDSVLGAGVGVGLLVWLVG